MKTVIITEVFIRLDISSAKDIFDEPADHEAIEKHVANLFGPTFYPLAYTEYPNKETMIHYPEDQTEGVIAEYTFDDFGSWNKETTNVLKRISRVFNDIELVGITILNADVRTEVIETALLSSPHNSAKNIKYKDEH